MGSNSPYNNQQVENYKKRSFIDRSLDQWRRWFTLNLFSYVSSSFRFFLGLSCVRVNARLWFIIFRSSW